MTQDRERILQELLNKFGQLTEEEQVRLLHEASKIAESEH